MRTHTHTQQSNFPIPERTGRFGPLRRTQIEPLSAFNETKLASLSSVPIRPNIEQRWRFGGKFMAQNAVIEIYVSFFRNNNPIFII